MNPLQPTWPAPSHVKAYTTMRYHGNLAAHVGDVEKDVEINRSRLKSQLNLPNEPFWLKQTHSIIALPIDDNNKGQEADASFTNKPNQICVVLTADCLPILVCDRKGTQVAAIHAGWRGLCNGIIEATLNALNIHADEVLAWLGPAIGPQHFEVGSEVRDIFLKNDPTAESAFIPSPNQRWLANLFMLARLRFNKIGVNAIYGGEYCTYSQPEKFFSYRRDSGKTGRIASLIWLNP